MRVSGLVFAFLAVLVLLGTCVPAEAVLTGSPAADAGWAFNANSLNNGAYIAGVANFGYDMYSASFLADSSLAASIGVGWTPGDAILAIGGKIQSTTGIAAGWAASFTGAAVNSNLTSSARVITKFGSLVSNTVTTSTVRPDGGNGSGSFSGGKLGDGSILLATQSGGTFFTSANQNTFLPLTFNQRYDATTNTVTNLSSDIGRIIYKTGATDVVDSWEVLLNTRLLAGSYTLIPTPGAKSVLSMQRGTNATTDAMLSVAAVPEANSLLFGCVAIGAVSLAITARRLKNKLGL